MITKKKPREVTHIDGKLYTKRGVELSRNAQTETQAEHMAKIRSALRNSSRFWKPALKALQEARRDYKGINKRIKHEYQCAACLQWWVRKDVEINHVVPCGSLKCYEDVPEFLRKLFCEDSNGYNVLCKECHKSFTRKGRNNGEV